MLLAVIQVSAANVNLAQAQASAQRFMMGNSATQRFNGLPMTNLKLISTEVNSTHADQAVYYIFNSDRGFVIVAGDDRAQEILAYGDKPLDLKRMPDNMKFWLSTYKKQIEYLQAHPGMEVESNTSRMNKSLKATTVAPMLTAMWDQSTPYYNQCPTYNGSRCLTGCPATSLSMVFYYWKYPTDPTPEVEGYTTETNSIVVPALPSITFDWDNMLDIYTYGNYNTTQSDAVAWLMRYIGQAEQMDYAPSASGAMGEDILRAVKFFGYDEETAELVFKTKTDDAGNDTAVYYTDDEWTALLQNELAEGRPVVYCAYDYSMWYGWSGHAFNVDGYTANTNTYHVNWGWSGDGNGDFALNAFSSSGYTFNIEQQMVMGIQPPVNGPSIKVSPSRLEMETYVDQSTTATFTVKGKELTSDVTLMLNDESGYFSMDANSVAVSDLEDGKVITVTYAPLTSGNHSATITLSNPDADDKVVTINGNATIDATKPVMLPADSAYINLTEFRADWTDLTDAKYVSSYTLMVGTKPGTQLISESDFSDYPAESGNQASRASELIPEGWTFEGSGLWLDGASIEPSSGCTLTTPTFDLSGYDKVTVVVTFKSWSSYTAATLSVATSKGSETFTGTTEFTDYTAVLECGDTENIVFTAGYYPMIQKILIYAGELDPAKMREVAEEGDTTQRLITGITDKFYTVKNLEAGGTFYYRVKAQYIDGTESAWSNIQNITLYENGHGFDLGDVNHDGSFNIKDVSALIDAVLSGEEVCPICADVKPDGLVNIADVSYLIDLLLLSY